MRDIFAVFAPHEGPLIFRCYLFGVLFLLKFVKAHFYNYGQY
jgi:hypothetical protein